MPRVSYSEVESHSQKLCQARLRLKTLVLELSGVFTV